MVGTLLVALPGGMDQIGSKKLMWNPNQAISPWFTSVFDVSLMP
jgi:hypothetical protein